MPASTPQQLVQKSTQASFRDTECEKLPKEQCASVLLPQKAYFGLQLKDDKEYPTPKGIILAWLRVMSVCLSKHRI